MLNYIQQHSCRITASLRWLLNETKVYTQFIQWHNKSHSCNTASNEPWQQVEHVWVYTTPTYATLHVALITINFCLRHLIRTPFKHLYGSSTLLSNLLLIGYVPKVMHSYTEMSFWHSHVSLHQAFGTMGILFLLVIPTVCQLESANGAQCRVDIIIQTAAAIMGSAIYGNGEKH